MVHLLLPLLALLSMASTSALADTHSDCGLAETAFGMCVPYVMGDEQQLDPKCCSAVQTVNGLASRSESQRDICDCLLKLMVRVGKINSDRAATLPGTCGIKTNVIPTSLAFDCSTNYAGKNRGRNMVTVEKLRGGGGRGRGGGGSSGGSSVGAGGSSGFHGSSGGSSGGSSRGGTGRSTPAIGGGGVNAAHRNAARRTPNHPFVIFLYATAFWTAILASM